MSVNDPKRTFPCECPRDSNRNRRGPIDDAPDVADYAPRLIWGIKMTGGVLPMALHRGESDLPFVPYQEGVTFQLNQVDIEAGFFVVRLRGEPGRTIQQHKHTGEIFAFTQAGSWRYLEYPEINTAGSYLYDPAGSIHTLHFPETNTETTDVW